jgi:transcriptional regulator with XRE-family HTH domain
MGQRTADDPVLAAFGDRVRFQRQKLGLSQEKLGHATGLHMSYISSVERGRRNVSLLNIVKIAEALKLDPGKLLSGLGRL